VTFLLSWLGRYQSECAGWPGLFRRLLWHEDGQDLVEYALLAAFVGVVGAFVLQSMGVTIFNTYTSWIDPAVGAPSLWEPAIPLVSSGGS
jgi:Flp pilus assembly pilin Flp